LILSADKSTARPKTDSYSRATRQEAQLSAPMLAAHAPEPIFAREF